MLIDINTGFGFWPFQSFAQNSPEKLNGHMRKAGISSALVSSIDAVLHPEPDTHNKALLKKLRNFPELRPVMVINPLLADWMERLSEYRKSGSVNAVKIFPAYHGFKVVSSTMGCFLEELEAARTVLMLQVRIEDERSQYPRMQVPALDTREIIRLANNHPGCNIICLCASAREIKNMTGAAKNIYADISYADGLNVIPFLLREIPADRILFGSHTPFFCTESARMKMSGGGIPESDAKMIFSENILKLLGEKNGL